MLLAPVEYYRPDTIEEALEALQTDGARPLAGGQSLISILKLRATTVDLLVDISRVDDLRSISVADDGSVTIGAGVTYDEMAMSPDLHHAYPGLSTIAAHTVDAQVRNRGTFGGNLCHNDPINNFPPFVVAVDAVMHATGANGSRDIPAGEFFTGYFTNALTDDELLTSVTLPPLNGRSIGYQEIEIGEAAARAVAIVAMSNGSIESASVALGCLPIPVRRPAVESALAGADSTPEAVAEATAAAGDGIEPVSDADASADYRRAMAPVVAKRAVLEAIQGGHHG
ncbi:MAG: xanthine dehydrogenase family protein subunit M [Acidimicrobiia bacterium]|nr:xanthine dehydrogenase family protein subunit M [Acidimicrobiia bacterium]